jgi:hypothetical protein
MEPPSLVISHFTVMAHLESSRLYREAKNCQRRLTLSKYWSTKSTIHTSTAMNNWYPKFARNAERSTFFDHPLT